MKQKPGGPMGDTPSRAGRVSEARNGMSVEERRNLTLIGMPGSGKTTNGVFLARAAGLRFVDTDRMVERAAGRPLRELAADLGAEGFRDLEGRVIRELDLTGSVIATGGSVIYREAAMERLRAISRVVYLRLSYETVAARLRDLRRRGVSLQEGQTLRELYDERCPLYERWADCALDCDGLKPREIVAGILTLTGRA